MKIVRYQNTIDCLPWTIENFNLKKINHRGVISWLMESLEAAAKAHAFENLRNVYLDGENVWPKVLQNVARNSPKELESSMQSIGNGN